MEEIIKELKKITEEDIEKIIEVYEDMPECVIKDSLGLTLSTWNIVKKCYEKNKNMEVKKQ